MITVERHVRADPERLWGFVGRLADWAELLPTIDAIEAVSDGSVSDGPVSDGPVSDRPAPAVGSRYAIKQPHLPRMAYEVTEWVPGRRFTWVAAAVGVRTIGTHEVGAAADGSTLRLTLDWTGPLAPVVRLLLTRRTTRYVRLEADSFTHLAEAGESPRTTRER